METANKVTGKVLGVGYKIWTVVSSKWFMILMAILAVVMFFVMITVKVIVYTNENEPVFQPLVVWAWPKLQTPLYWIERKPITILTPVVVEPVQKKDVEHLTKDEKREIIRKVAKNYPKQVERIWMLESSEGEITDQTDPTALHLFCHNLGLTNEFGFDPQGRGTGNRCFNTFEDSVKAVDALLTDFLSKYTLNQSLCLYSGNGVTNACDYLGNYLSLE